MGPAQNLIFFGSCTFMALYLMICLFLPLPLLWPLLSFSESDEGLALETSAPESLYGGQFTLSTQLIKPNYLAKIPLMQHHSFFRNLPPFLVLISPKNGFSFAGKLLGHLFTIVDVAVNEKDQQLISLSTARVRNAINIHYKCKLVNAGFSK